LKRTLKGIRATIIVVFVVVGTLSPILCSGSDVGVQNTLRTTPQSQGDFSPVSIHKQGCYDGYTLLSTFDTELIDMNGKLIHRWPVFVPQPAKMLPGGSIIVGDKYKLFGFSCGDFNALEELDWNGSITWSYNKWEDGRARQHHDFQREGNPVGYYAPGQEFIPQGKTLILAHHSIINTSISKNPLIDEVIYEVDWNGSFTGLEWHASDHFNQMGFDNTTKHGIYVNPGILGDGDWLHVNSMSTLGENPWYTMDPVTYSCFNPENIIIDSRNTNFIAIISRNTGDIVWRVGPDYSKDTESGRKLGQIIGLHNAHMIPKGLPGEGDILVFDNGGMAGYGYFGMPSHLRLWSRVIEFNPITYDIVWQYSYITLNWLFPRTGEGHRFFSYYISSAQRLPNGNTLITEGSNGRVFEVTNTSKIVWEYDTPTRLRQLYRAYRIPPEWVPGNPSGYAFWEENNSGGIPLPGHS
jgi:hypothetical protein